METIGATDMGRPPISKMPGTFVGVTLQPELLAALDRRARKIAGAKGKPNRPKTIRAVLAEGLGVRNRENDDAEFG